MPAERLQKILSNAGVASRRVAEELILAGRVAINGEVVQTLGARADPETDDVTVDGVPVLRGRYRYFALNKPAGFVTTTADERGRPTVLDLVPIGDVQLHPVGRLDMDSEGLVILTNDGHLTSRLTHPRFEVEKEYLVALDAPLSASARARWVRGVESGGERLRVRSVKQVDGPPGEDLSSPPLPASTAWYLVTLTQGRNREIRRLAAAVGRQVLVIRRIRIGSLHLGTLGPGAFRELGPDEVTALYRVAAGERPNA